MPKSKEKGGQCCKLGHGQVSGVPRLSLRFCAVLRLGLEGGRVAESCKVMYEERHG